MEDSISSSIKAEGGEKQGGEQPHHQQQHTGKKKQNPLFFIDHSSHHPFLLPYVKALGHLHCTFFVNLSYIVKT